MKNGFNYAPSGGKTLRVVQPGEFVFAAACLDHGHIYGQTNGLLEAGATLKYVYDSDAKKVAAFLDKYKETGVCAASSLRQILDDPEVRLVAAAAVPCERGPLGCAVMEAGKDYFTDKCPFTTLEQLAQARASATRTGRKYIVYYSERLHVESAWYVDELLQGGVIGNLVHMTISGPHRLSKAQRPAWFFEKAKYGGVLADICSHQFDQFLHYARARDGEILHARVENFANSDTPELEDFGEAVLRLDTGASCHSRVDWFTPDGLRSWGDGRSVFIGTQGYIEVRKYLDFCRDGGGDLVLVADAKGEHLVDCKGRVGFPFFGQFILDCLRRTETAMTQEHAFKAAELSLKAQLMADARKGEN